MEDLEAAFTAGLGGMKQYDPWMELHVMFKTANLDAYTTAFQAAGVPTFDSTFVAEDGTKYYSLLAQVDGSLRVGAGSFILVEIVGAESETLRAADAAGTLYRHAAPRASASSLQAATPSSATTTASTTKPPALTMLHISFPSANLTQDTAYFEDVLGGSKTSSGTANGTKYYTGKLFADDTVELRWAESPVQTQSDLTFADYEKYVTALHSACIPTPNYDNQGFDRLADNHIGGHGTGGASLEELIERQIDAKLPYRVYKPPGNMGNTHFLYLYGPNGWGYQLTGQCSSTKYCSNTVFYDMCTQGITGHCRSDLPSSALS